MIGTIVNATMVLLASLFGYAIGRKIKEDVRDRIMKVLGLTIIFIGLKMAFETKNPVLIIASVVIGTVIGEMLKIEDGLESFAAKIERKFSGFTFAEGFVTATILFCVGPMAVVGSIREGLTGDASIILAKTMLDMVSALFLSAIFGLGVALSSLSILAYQGTITIFAGSVASYMTEEIIAEVTASGGIIVMAIGFNVVGLSRFKAANMLPALIVAPLGVLIYSAL
ncbi:protein of unknown function DUF554 [Ferroglobus placidus DSM 10642]|uniref:DUF554 domain-containing protein n=1 Tax=Ferroglobus placidus (strain DSM 10642 / AEDII12DO) TaxID=589924 RepID=D3S3H9_FERPA|nr:DUF554 domain-containing protein [Ferroglobus placidus]ADC64812.1 protein of unknown function DUF554 [Ferroglobus placidus DSM 10642]